MSFLTRSIFHPFKESSCRWLNEILSNKITRAHLHFAATVSMIKSIFVWLICCYTFYLPIIYIRFSIIRYLFFLFSTNASQPYPPLFQSSKKYKSYIVEKYPQHYLVNSVFFIPLSFNHHGFPSVASVKTITIGFFL